MWLVLMWKGSLVDVTLDLRKLTCSDSISTALTHGARMAPGDRRPEVPLAPLQSLTAPLGFSFPIWIDI